MVKYVFRFRYFLASFSANDDGDAETEAVEEAGAREKWQQNGFPQSKLSTV